MLAVALVAVDVDWTAGRALMIPLAIAGGTLIYSGVWIALATIAFWIVDAIELVNAFTYGGNFLSALPDHDLRPLAAEPRRLRDPDRVRLLLPGAVRARQAPTTLGLPEALQLSSRRSWPS